MRTVSIRFDDMGNHILYLGYAGENKHTRVLIDCKKIFEDYPAAVPVLSVTPPKGDKYPATISREGNTVIWDVTDSDLIYDGGGEVQLTFVEDEVVAKSPKCRTKIEKSIVANGQTPTPIADWLVRAETVLEAIPEEINAAIEEAKESGLFDGVGISSIGYVSTVGKVNKYRINLTNGQHYDFEVNNGDDGENGVGIVSIAKTGSAGLIDTYTVTLTNGQSYPITVTNGRDGSVPIDDTTPALNKVFSSEKVDTELNTVKRALNEVETEADTLSDMLTEVVETPVAVTLTVQTNGYYNTSGTFVSTTDRAYAIVDGVHAGDKYILSTFVRPVTIAGLIMFAGTTFYGYNYLGTGADQDIVDAQFTIPNTVTKIIVQSAKDSKPPTLKKVVGTQVSKSYTKEESRALIEGTPQKYGVRWSVTDTNDLGQRCFNAVGLSATIGIGSTNGSSDFDSIYPWSDIKRCNIKANTNGAFVVTYEGETGFALDGTNGDVFVRIPKFYVDKYIENGYEYRVISAVGTIPHKLFIENGVELDEVFIGAYEGYSNGTVLKSISSVIPSSNMTTAQFLALAQANGDNYSLFDMRCVDAIWTLMAVEYGCRNSNQILGYGIADYMQPIYSSYQICTLAANNTNTIRTGKWSNSNKAYMPVGSNMTICGSQNQETIIAQRKIVSVSDGTDYTDWTFDGDPINVDTNCFIGSAACNTNFIDTCSAPLTWHTGRANYVTGGAATTRNPVRYRWIENPVGNLWHFLPDAIFKNLQMYVCENMADYDVSQLADEYKPIGALMTAQESNGLKTDETGSNYWITNLLNDPFAKGSCIGKTASTAITSVKAFGGYYYMYNRDNLVTIAHGGGFDHLYRCNMLTNRAWILPTTKWYLYGARLMFKKVS